MRARPRDLVAVFSSVSVVCFLPLVAVWLFSPPIYILLIPLFGLPLVFYLDRFMEERGTPVASSKYMTQQSDSPEPPSGAPSSEAHE